MQPRHWHSLIFAAMIGLTGVVAFALLSRPISAQVSTQVSAQAPTSLPWTSSKPTTNTLNDDATVVFPKSASSVVLYNQLDNPAGLGSSSQKFEPGFTSYNDFSADDFVVPADQIWNMDLVEVDGQYFNGPGPAGSVNVFIYSNAITLPGTLLAARTDISYTAGPGVGDFIIPLNPAVALSPGAYWISVQANQIFSPTGQWAWTDRTVTSTHPAAWQNPGGGFYIPCPVWKVRTACLGDPAAADQVFRLSGGINPINPVLPPLVCGTPGPWTLRNFLPTPVYGAGVGNDGTYAYAVGGYSFQTSRDVTQIVRYNPMTNVWSPLAPVPGAVSMASAVYAPINNKLYVFGGELAATGQVFTTTRIYDIGGNSWSTGAPLPDLRAIMGSGYYNGKIYLVGGYSTGSVTPAYSQTWEYDVLANTWLTKTNMPQALGGSASAVVNGHLYIIGGRIPSNTISDQTYDYDIAGDTWFTRTKIPTGVNVPGTAVLGGKVWVIGGGSPFMALDNQSQPSSVNAPEAFSTTQIYDPIGNSWSAGPGLNVQRSFVGATGFGNFAIAIGGYNGSTTTGATEVTQNCPLVQLSAPAYSVIENVGSATITATLNAASSVTAKVNFATSNGTALAGSDYTATSGRLTFAPGQTSRTFSVPIIDDTLLEESETFNVTLSGATNATLGVPGGAVVTIVDNNDPPPPMVCGSGVSGPWVLRNFLPTPVYGASVTNDGTYAYAVGGYSFQAGGDVTQTARYNPLTNVWTTLAPLTDALSQASAVYAPINNKLYVFGGEHVNLSQVLSTTRIYDVGGNSWSTGAPMSDIRAFMGAGYYNGKIYLVGGYSTGNVTPAYAQIWEYDVLANTWLTKTNMPRALGGPASAVVNGHLYIIGGRTPSNTISSETYDYDIAGDTWFTRTNIPTGVNVPGTAVHFGNIWVIGGGSPFLALDRPAQLANVLTPVTTNRTQIYRPTGDSWSAGPNLNIQRSFVGATGFGNFAVAIGGYNGNTTTGATEVTCFPNAYLPVVMKNY